MVKSTEADTPALFVVVESFVAPGDNGLLTQYLKGEVVEAGHPMLKVTPGSFRPYAFPHPVKRRAVMVSAPEVRAD